MPSKSNEYAYESGRISTATATTSSAIILPADPRRRYTIICNTGSADCYLAIGTAAIAGRGILLKAEGGAYEMMAQNLTHAAVCALTAAGTTALAIQEGI